MNQKIKFTLFLCIISLVMLSRTAFASTYYAASAKEQIMQFNRAMASNDRVITLEYDPAKKGDYIKRIYDLSYSLQDYADSDYAYYNMAKINTDTTQGRNGKEIYYIDYRITGIETQEQTKYVYDTVHKLIRDNPSIIKASNYNKAAWAFDYVINHVVYDDSNTNYSAYSALQEGKSVCQGYAMLYYALTTQLGLKCRIVSGTGKLSKVFHAWNLIQLEGKWYYVDTTRGAKGSGRRFFLELKKEETTYSLNPIYESYFDFATEEYVENGNSGYAGIQASVYDVTFDTLKRNNLKSGETFQWMIQNPKKIKLTFTSSRPGIATVNKKGVITGKAAGTALITVVNKTLGIKQECKIIVSKNIKAE